MSAQVHPQAFVGEGAQLADGVVVGPGAYVGAAVKIGKGTIIHPHAHVDGHTELGEGNHVFPYASVGCAPQDLKYKGEPTRLKIGDRNMIREFTTLNLGTVQGGGITTIGNENLIMAYAHIAHDCVVGNRCVLTNNVLLAGHVTLEDNVILGALSAIHQFSRVGAHVIVSANSMIARDVPPFCIAAGRGGELYGLNSIGLRRRGFGKETMSALKKAYRAAFRGGLRTPEAVQLLRTEFKDTKEAQQLADFLSAPTKRGFLQDSSRRRKGKKTDAAAPDEAASE